MDRRTNGPTDRPTECMRLKIPLFMEKQNFETLKKSILKSDFHKDTDIQGHQSQM